MEKKTINPDTCCVKCLRYATGGQNFPIWCSDNECSCHNHPSAGEGVSDWLQNLNYVLGEPKFSERQWEVILAIIQGHVTDEVQAERERLVEVCEGMKSKYAFDLNMVGGYNKALSDIISLLRDK